jgi:hypothetical protein
MADTEIVHLSDDEKHVTRVHEAAHAVCAYITAEECGTPVEDAA